MIVGPLWQRVRGLERRLAASLHSEDVPTGVGVYAWFRDGQPVYAGRAIARGGLRGRVFRKHLAVGLDLSRSSFRRNVCDHILGIPTSVTKQRPTVMTEDQVRQVNDWIRGCEVTWLEFDTIDEAKQFEKQLLAEWMPSLSRR